MDFPYIVYGIVKEDGVLQSGVTVTATNTTKGGSASETTDANGHYEIDLMNLSNGYDVGDTIEMSYSTLTKSFTVDSGFEYEMNLRYWPNTISMSITLAPSYSLSSSITVSMGISLSPVIGFTFVLSATETITLTAIQNTMVLFDIDNYNIVSWEVSKSITDNMWAFSGTIDGHTLPSSMKHFKIHMKDHTDTDQLIFFGVYPGGKASYEIANNKYKLNGYDNAWYLAKQSVPSSIRVTDETTNPADTVKTLLGDSDWLKTTGIDPYSGNVNTVSGWSSIQKQFVWKNTTTKQTCISDICDYVGFIFHIKFGESGSIYSNVAYFVDYDDIDNASIGFDLPAKVTFTNPDPYVISIEKETDETEKYNRIIVYATNRETGEWATGTKEAPEVTTGDELPSEYVLDNYVVEPPPADTTALQTAANDKATELYDLYYTNATTIRIIAKLRKRADLELWQKVAFSGYTDIPTGDMRVVSIKYSHSIVDDIVTIKCVPDKDLSTEDAREKAVGDYSFVELAKDTTIDTIDSTLTDYEVGTVISITGDVATVQLEKDGKTVPVRVGHGVVVGDVVLVVRSNKNTALMVGIEDDYGIKMSGVVNGDKLLVVGAQGRQLYGGGRGVGYVGVRVRPVIPDDDVIIFERVQDHSGKTRDRVGINLGGGTHVVNVSANINLLPSVVAQVNSLTYVSTSFNAYCPNYAPALFNFYKNPSASDQALRIDIFHDQLPSTDGYFRLSKTTEPNDCHTMLAFYGYSNYNQYSKTVYTTLQPGHIFEVYRHGSTYTRINFFGVAQL